MNTLEFRDGALYLLDQTKLPLETVVLECREVEQVAEAIVNLSVRGAPAIGLSAAYGVVLAALRLWEAGVDLEVYFASLDQDLERLRSTRPTAVNLFWALQRMQRVIDPYRQAGERVPVPALQAEADSMLAEDLAANQAMGLFGADLIPDGGRVLTHCNAGALATGALGTALGVIRAAHEQGKHIHVWVDETRPLLQGSRLTAWELKQMAVPFTLITDSMAGHFMSQGRIDLAMVGADRIVANGDAANKIGTYSVAVLAHAHGIPFYFVAPTSTVDLATRTGADIQIEERNPLEVATFRGVRTAPEDIAVANPAFDVTPACLIAAIVTERGVIRAPFADGLAAQAALPFRPVETQRTALSDPEPMP